MTNLVPSIPIILDRPRLLRFDVNAMIAAQQVTGRSFYESLGLLFGIQRDLAAQTGNAPADPVRLAELGLEVLAKLPLVDIRALLWAGLLRDDPSVTVEGVGAMLSPLTVMGVLAALASALSEQGPEPPASGNPTEPSPGTTA